MYYGKQNTIWGVAAPQASWMVRKIRQMHQVFEQVGWTEADVKQMV